MNLYEKIGRLIKQKKIFDLSNSSNNNSNNNEKEIGFELENFESLLSEILSPLTSEIQSPISHISLKNNKIISKSDLEEAQKLIKSCSQDQQLILIAILEIQISLNDNENIYIKYEKFTEKIIEKNIYWVINLEIHKRIHRTKVDFKEYCHCIKDEKDENILNEDDNFKYDKIDSIICQLKEKNKSIELIGIKSIFISFYNLICEFVDKYVEIMEYNKNNKPNGEYLIFDYIINDYIYIIENIKFLNEDFKQSINDFNANYKINFSLENLFQEIFFNVIFHNQILGFQYIQGFIHSDSDIKNLFAKILKLIGNIKNPLMKQIAKILNIDNLFSYKIDLMTKITEQNEQLHICVGVGKCEIKHDDEKGEIIGKKEIFYIRGKIGKKDNDEEDFNIKKIFIDMDKDNSKDNSNDSDDNDSTIIEKNIINKTIIESTKTEDDTEDKKEIIINNETSEKMDINNNNDNNKNINDDNIKENKNIDNNKSKIELKEDKINMDDKSLDEIYEYINKDNKVKGKKKHKKRNKAKKKKNKYKKENNESTMDNSEDPIVIQFKNDIQESVIFAKAITKIKPLISDNFIKKIACY